jgi:tellurite resistance protein
MPFLDNLLSDLIQSSTGFNAKPFVRAVGGKNILLLGGAAIAGVLAAEKMRSQPSVPGAPPLPVPPPPPLPSAATSVPPVPPPIPAAAPEAALPKGLVFAIVRTMISAALSDGDMHDEERKLIEKRLGESGLGAEETKQIRKDLVFPPTPDEIGTMVSTTEDRELLYRFGALVARSQGGTSAEETAWLERLGGALGIPAARRTALEAEIFAT